MRFKTLIIAIIALAGCTVVSRQQNTQGEKTQLEVREFQTRTYDTNNVKLIMKALVNTLQDDGFIIKNAVVDLGLISATKEIDLTKRSSASNKGVNWGDVFVAIFSKDGNSRQSSQDETYNKIKIIEASINVSDFGNQSKVRANFSAKILDNKGDAVDVVAVDDAKFYQDFFAKVDKGIFIQKSGL